MTYEEALRRAKRQLFIYKRKVANGQKGYDDLCELYQLYVDALVDKIFSRSRKNDTN